MARRRAPLAMPKSRSMVPNSASAAGVACAAGEADRESIASPPGGKGFEPGREQGFHGRGSGIVVQPALAIGAQSIVEGLDADPEELGSPGAVVVHRAEGAEDQAALDLGDGIAGADGKAVVGFGSGGGAEFQLRSEERRVGDG